MKEIVTRLQENRQVELAKSILESNGYKVAKKAKRLKESGSYPFISREKFSKMCRDNNLMTGVPYSDYREVLDLASTGGYQSLDELINDIWTASEGFTRSEVENIVNEYLTEPNKVKESKVGNQNLDDNPAYDEQGRTPKPRRGRKPNADLKDDGVFAPDSEDDRLHRGLGEDIDYEDEDQEYSSSDFFGGKKYWIYGEKSYDLDDSDFISDITTDDPREAIEGWYKILNKGGRRSGATIMAKKKADAVEIAKAGTEEFIHEMHSKYKCPYKEEYISGECKKIADRGTSYMSESEYGDQVHPFSFG